MNLFLSLMEMKDFFLFCLDDDNYHHHQHIKCERVNLNKIQKQLKVFVIEKNGEYRLD